MIKKSSPKFLCKCIKDAETIILNEKWDGMGAWQNTLNAMLYITNNLHF